MTAKSRLIALERKAAPPEDKQIFVHLKGGPYTLGGKEVTEAEYREATKGHTVIKVEYVETPLPGER
jgi:hypothetical protein